MIFLHSLVWKLFSTLFHFLPISYNKYCFIFWISSTLSITCSGSWVTVFSREALLIAFIQACYCTMNGNGQRALGGQGEAKQKWADAIGEYLGFRRFTNLCVLVDRNFLIIQSGAIGFWFGPLGKKYMCQTHSEVKYICTLNVKLQRDLILFLGKAPDLMTIIINAQGFFKITWWHYFLVARKVREKEKKTKSFIFVFWYFSFDFCDHLIIFRIYTGISTSTCLLSLVSAWLSMSLTRTKCSYSTVLSMLHLPKKVSTF